MRYINSNTFCRASGACFLAALTLATVYNQTFAGQDSGSELLDNISTGTYYVVYALSSFTVTFATAAIGALVVEEKLDTNTTPRP